MRRGGPLLLLAVVAALAAGCDRPAPKSRRLVLSAPEVFLYVTDRDPAPFQLYAMHTEPVDQRETTLSATVEVGGEWLAVEGPSGLEPYELRLHPTDAALAAPGGYSARLRLRSPGTEDRTVQVWLWVTAPPLQASQPAVRFHLAPGGTATPQTVLAAPVYAPPGRARPAARVAIQADQGCRRCDLGVCTSWLEPHGVATSAWIDAQVVTSGAGYAVTLTPNEGALAALPSGALCSGSAVVRADFDPPPGTGTGPLMDSAVAIPVTVAIQAPGAALSDPGWPIASTWDVLAGEWASGAHTFALTNVFEGELPRPSVVANDPGVRASVSAAAPWVITLEQVRDLAPGDHCAELIVPAGTGSYGVNACLRAYAWRNVYWGARSLGATATEIAEGQVLFAGGRRPDWKVDPGGRFVASSDLWVDHGTGELMTPRLRHTATLFAPGHLVAAGGLDPATGVPVGTFEIFDDRHAHAWYVERSLQLARFGHTATLLDDGRVLVAGGAVGTEKDPVAIADVELLDPGEPNPTSSGSSPTPAWAARSVAGFPMLVPRRDAAAVRLPSGRILVAGGQRVAGAALSSAEIYDPATGRWTLAAPMNAPRAAAALVLLGDGRVLAAGGTDGVRALGTAELYDPVHDTWTSTGALHHPRLAPGVRLPSGRVLLLGGMTGDVDARGVTETAERYDPATGSWTLAGALNEARTGHAVTVLKDGRVVVSGGTRALPWDDSTLPYETLVGHGEAP